MEKKINKTFREGVILSIIAAVSIIAYQIYWYFRIGQWESLSVITALDYLGFPWALQSQESIKIYHFLSHTPLLIVIPLCCFIFYFPFFLLIRSADAMIYGTRDQSDESIHEFILLIVGLVIVWIIYWWAMLYFIEKWEDRSAFGEMFGSINTLFSGAALAGVIYAIFLQRRELVLQREESRSNDIAQKKSLAALREQIKEMQKQSELQLMPFVVLVKEEDSYFLCNAGNGTAVNIMSLLTLKLNESGEIRDHKCENYHSILTKEQKYNVQVPTNFHIVEESGFIITFHNISKKAYCVRGRIRTFGTEIITFGPYEPK